MQIKWKEQQSTILGLGVILLVLGVFSYIIWITGKDSMDKIVEEEPPIEEYSSVSNESAGGEEELPEYPITKVDTTGWEYRETQLADVGLRYKVFNKDIDNRSGDLLSLEPHFDLESFGIQGLMIGAESNIRLGKGYDKISINDCVNCGGGPYDPAPGRMNIDIVENSELNLNDISDILLNQTCSYSIVKTDDINPYAMNEKCTTDEEFVAYNPSLKLRESKKIGDIVNLRVSGKEILQYKNPFITTDKISQLIQYPIAIGVQDLSENNIEDPEIVFDDQLVFVIDLGNDKFAVITQSAYPEDRVKTNSLMHTILSTIEVMNL